MGTKDNYYTYPKDKEAAFYDWERQFINLGCTIEDISLNRESEFDEVNTYEKSKLVHEYIHFLQNFAFTWGVPVFTDFSLSYLKIASSSALSNEKYSLPFPNNTITNKLLNDGLEQRDNVIERMNLFDEMHEFDNGILCLIKLDLSNSDYIKLNNGQIEISIGMKVIREHMAHMGTMLFLSKTDTEIHIDNENYEGFIAKNKKFNRNAEYWIIFEFFKEQNKFKGIAKGIFFLMQQSLVTLHPVSFIKRFFVWYNANIYRFNENEYELIDLVNNWMINKSINIEQEIDIEKSIQHCKNICDLCMKHMNDHDYYNYVYNIAKNSLDHLISTTGGNTLFIPSDDLSNFEYWKSKIIKCGTGIVSYSNGHLIHGTKGYINNMSESFTNLLSSSIVFKRIKENKLYICPFLYDIPICNASYKGNHGCSDNPFTMTNPEPNGEECLFRNGVILMGFENRIEFPY